jgi:hypothetical protein
MEARGEQEQRRHSRYSIHCSVSVREGAISQEPAAIIRGEAQNISQGGLCLLLDRGCTVSSLLKCDIFFPGFSAAIPTLAYVRWVRGNSPDKFLVGVQFLID